MPRFVDHQERRRSILRAAASVLAEDGYANFSLRAIAHRMGGSSTLVTHYFSTRQELISALIEVVFDDAKIEHERLTRMPPGRERLSAVLEYFLPTDTESAEQERIRIALLPYRESDPTVGSFFARLEGQMRDLLRFGVTGAVRDEEVDFSVSLIRTWVNGIALSVVEHPELWATTLQRAIMQWLVDTLELPEHDERESEAVRLNTR